MDLQTLARQFEAFNSEVKDLAGDISEILDRQDKVELRLNRPGAHGDLDHLGNPRSADAKKRMAAFGEYIRRGREGMSPDRVNVLIEADDTAGGYLAPPDFVTELIRNIVQFSPIRELARVGTTSMGTVHLPKRTGQMTATFNSEVDTSPATGPTYGMVDIPINMASAHVDISASMLEDSAFDMNDQLAFDFAEEFGRLEGNKFVLGSGLKEPEGFLNAPNVATVPSLSATSINPDSAFNCFYSLKPYYRNRSTWTCNGTTLALLRTLKDGIGQYLWRQGTADGQPETFLGRPIVESVDMPNVASGALPLAIADWENAYRIYGFMTSRRFSRCCATRSRSPRPDKFAFTVASASVAA
jgi:HK97 family phage major capsid protein